MWRWTDGRSMYFKVFNYAVAPILCGYHNQMSAYRSKLLETSHIGLFGLPCSVKPAIRYEVLCQSTSIVENNRNDSNEKSKAVNDTIITSKGSTIRHLADSNRKRLTKQQMGKDPTNKSHEYQNIQPSNKNKSTLWPVNFEMCKKGWSGWSRE